MKVAFQTNHWGERGTEVAVFDYAKYNVELLGNESYITICKKLVFNQLVYDKFVKQFGEDHILAYDEFSEVEPFLDNNNIDVFYALKAGEEDEKVSIGRKTCVHCVFRAYQPHGDVYAYVSEWLSKHNENLYNTEVKYVDHIVHMQRHDDNFREEFNIPKDSYVFGRYGGYDTFDLGFVHQAIRDMLMFDENVYFIFANTQTFIDHERCLFLSSYIDDYNKVKFINTSDCMIHARGMGESFGLSIAEFSYNNRPVALWSGGEDRNHVSMMKDVGIFYNDYNDVRNIFMTFRERPDTKYDVVSDKFSPERVMKKFDQVFLK